MAKERVTMAGILAPRRWTPAEIVELAVAHDLAELEVEAGGTRRHPLESETFRALLGEPEQLPVAA